MTHCDDASPERAAVILLALMESCIFLGDVPGFEKY